jgi:hypothetical protein
MKRNTRKSIVRSNGQARSAANTSPHPDQRYDRARALADEGNYAEARRIYATLDTDQVTPSLRADAINSLAVLDALEERFHAARAGSKRALTVDPNCECARRNLAGLESCGCGADDEKAGQ